MLDQATGYGGSLAKLVAVESAVPLLDEDWATIDVFIQETLSRQDFPYLLVVDYQGIIRGSNDAAQVNTKYVPHEATTLAARDARPRRAEVPSRRRAPRAGLHGARPFPVEGNRPDPPRSLRSPADRRRQSHARAARHPHARHEPGRGGRHVPSRASAGRSDPRPAQFARRARGTAATTTASPRSARTSSASCSPISTGRPPLWRSVMIPSHRALPRRRSSPLRALGWVAAALLVHGCATPPPARARAGAPGRGRKAAASSRATTTSRSWSVGARRHAGDARRSATSATRAGTGGSRSTTR